MKRFEISTRPLLVFCLALGIPSMLSSCGDSSGPGNGGAGDGGGGNRDAVLVVDGNPAERLVDSSGDRAAPPQLDASVDLQVSADAGTNPADASLDAVTVTEPDALQLLDTPALAIDSDLGENPDMPSVSDVPTAQDLPVASLDGDLSDSPITMSDVAMLDGAQTLDSTVDSVGTPGLITGWPTDTIDFGANPCGGGAPAARTFTLVNSGSTPVSITSAQFTGTAGYNTDAQGKIIAAGGSLIVTISAPGIPQTSAIPADYDDILTIQTDIPNDDQHLINVTESAQGAVVAWNTVQGFGSFGSLAPGHTSSASFKVSNTGNLPAVINLSANGAFAVTSTTPITIPAGNVVDASVAFTSPSSGGPAAGALWMSLANQVTLCHALPDPLGLTGTSINGAIALSAISLNFETACGATPVGQTLTVTNTGAASMDWSAVLESGSSSIFHLSSTGATLTPSSIDPEPSTVVTVTPASPSHAAQVTDTIDITTNSLGDTITHKVVLTQTPLGDVVTVVGPDSVELGSVPIASPALQSQPVTLTVHNDANPNSAPAVVTFQLSGPGAAYFTVTPSSVTVPAGKLAEVTVTFSPGSDPAIVTTGNHLDLAATLRWHVGAEANCGTDLADIPVTGTATLAQVTGIPTFLEFGLVNCGASALQQQIVVNNPGSASYQITSVTFVNSTYYALDYPDLPKAMPAGSSAIITVTPKSIPAVVSTVPDHATYNGGLTITTDAINDTPHQVILHMGAQGAIIASTPWPTEWNFGTASIGASRQLLVPVVNNGNVPVNAALADIIIAQGQSGVFSLNSPSTVLAGQTSNIVALFQPEAANTTFTATANLDLSVASDKVFCQPLPAGWNSSTRNIHMQGSSN